MEKCVKGIQRIFKLVNKLADINSSVVRIVVYICLQLIQQNQVTIDYRVN